MSTPLHERFRNWLGCWRGAAPRPDGEMSIIQFTLTPHFAGETIQVDVRVFDPATGALINFGAGFWGLDRRGFVVNSLFGMHMGHSTLHESPDDPDVLSMTGQLAGNVDFTVTFRVIDDEMEFNSRTVEGYAVHGKPVRLSATLHRSVGDTP